jgi:hypothetical protein
MSEPPKQPSMQLAAVARGKPVRCGFHGARARVGLLRDWTLRSQLHRQQTLGIPRGAIKAKLPLPDLQIRTLDENNVQVIYNSEVLYDGVVEYGRRSSIWSRDGNTWVMRFHQGTPYDP